MGLPVPALLDAMRRPLSGWADAAAWERIERLGAALPPVWDSGCFEVRLGAGCGQVDFQVCTQGAAGRRALASALAAGHPLPGGLPVLPQIEEWIGPETEIARRSPVLWLEYDLPGDEVRPPVLFFGGFDLISPSKAPRALEVRRWMERWLPLAANACGEAPLRRLEACVQALPPGSRPRFLASMRPARDSGDLRLVASVPVSGLRGWLREVGWPGEPRALDQALGVLGEVLEAQVHLDLGESVRPGLGVEFSASPGLWPAFVARLREHGLCDERGPAMLDWFGRERVLPEGAPWGATIDRGVMAKLVLSPEGALSAKAYLLFQAGYSLF